MVNLNALVAATTLLLTTASAVKRGLAFNDQVPITNFGGSFKGKKSQIDWHYNWDSTTSKKLGYAEFVPMLWNTNDDHTRQWHNNVVSWSKKGTKHILGFNEPDRPDQARMTPAAAVSGWKKHMEPFAGYLKLGAPAVSNGGYDWLKQFLDQCTGCHIDFVPVHWYNDHSIEHDLENWVKKICALVKGRQIWITEFQGFGSDAQQAAFLKKAMPFLDKNSCVARYAYFGTANNSKVLLKNGGPDLSALGQQYAYSPSGQGSI